MKGSCGCRRSHRQCRQADEATLKTIVDNYQKLLSDRLAHELGMVDVSKATGNAAATNHHKILAEVYRSMLDSKFNAAK